MDSCRVSVLSRTPCRLFRETKIWEVILAMQALDAVHLGMDSLNIVRHVGRLLDGVERSRPDELENDGDLIALLREMIDRRGQGTVRITKVKGHAREDLVRGEQVRELDREGNNSPDEADFGRQRVDPGVIGARRNLSGECRRWHLVVHGLHRFFHCYPPRCCEQ